MEHHHKKNHHNHHHHMMKEFKTKFWLSLFITIPIMVMAPTIQNILHFQFDFEGKKYVQFGLATLLFFYGGWPFLKGLKNEIKKGKPGMMTLIGLAISVAYLYSSAVVFGLKGNIFFWELASLISLMLLGHWIEMKSVMQASQALEKLIALLPSKAIRINKNGEQEEVSIDELKEDDLILVKPGDKIPADGTVEDGKSNVNESLITGEAKPVTKEKGDEVIGGAINQNGSLKILLSKTKENSYLNQVVKMVEEAQKTKSKTQNLTDKAAALLFYIALGSGILTLVVWLFLGEPFDTAMQKMVTVMIIACPHALGLAIPLVVAISTATSAKNGILIRNRTAFEEARKLTTIIFDKTGTLTEGAFGVSKYKSVSDNNDTEILKIAASIEKESEHPIGNGIVAKAKEENLALDDIHSFENLTGKGIKATYNDKKYYLGGPNLLKELHIDSGNNIQEKNDETIIYLIQNNKILGYITLADKIRSSSFETIKSLHEMDIKTIMATGDNKKVANSVSKELNMDECYAEVLPEDKQSIIKDLQSKNEKVAMAGDGVNDAPALAQANVGIAIGSGTDVASETADIILADSNPKNVVKLIHYSKETYRKMMQNIFWAAGYNILAIPVAAGVLSGVGITLNPAVGAILMSLSTVIVAINAQLLKLRLK